MPESVLLTVEKLEEIGEWARGNPTPDRSENFRPYTIEELKIIYPEYRGYLTRVQQGGTDGRA